MSIQISDIIKFIKSVGTSLLKDHSDIKVFQKGQGDYVTERDLCVQHVIKQELKKRYPNIQFLAEEENESPDDYHSSYWVLDPIDGTTNYICDYHHSAISLALVAKQEVQFGIIYNPYLDEMFYAIKNQGAFLNGKRIFCTTAPLNNIIVAIGTSPYYKNEKTLEYNFNLYKKIFNNCLDIRRSGSAALDLAYVACGRVGGYVEQNVKIWDYAAGKLLIQEAGGMVTNYQGDCVNLDLVTHIVAGSKDIVTALLKFTNL